MQILEPSTHVRYIDRGCWDPPVTIDFRVGTSHGRTHIEMSLSRVIFAHEWGPQQPTWDAYLQRVSQRLRSQLDLGGPPPAQTEDAYTASIPVGDEIRQSVEIFAPADVVWRLAMQVHGSEDVGQYWYTEVGGSRYLAGLTRASDELFLPTVLRIVEGPGLQATLRGVGGEQHYVAQPTDHGTELRVTTSTQAKPTPQERERVSTWLGRIKQLAEGDSDTERSHNDRVPNPL